MTFGGREIKEFFRHINMEMENWQTYYNITTYLHVKCEGKKMVKCGNNNYFSKK